MPIMTDHLVSEVVKCFQSEIGEPPTLAEFLQILGLSTPVVEKLPSPLRWEAKVRGKAYHVDEEPSRVAELNDATFVAAAELLTHLTSSSADLRGLADAVRDAVVRADVAFRDVSGSDVTAATAKAPKKSHRSRAGDIVAIPGPGGHRLAVVVEHNRFGMALGFLDGVFARPAAPATSHPAVVARPLYLDDTLIRNGSWPIVAHRTDLWELFPTGPEIYHAPDMKWPGVDIGPFGAAESPSGDLRLLARAEAAEIGLLDGTYQQFVPSSQLFAYLARNS